MAVPNPYGVRLLADFWAVVLSLQMNTCRCRDTYRATMGVLSLHSIYSYPVVTGRVFK